VLKIRKLLIFRDAKNAEHGKIALNWNVSGTQTFHHARQFREEGLPSPATPNSFPEHGTIKALIVAVAAERASKQEGQQNDLEEVLFGRLPHFDAGARRTASIHYQMQ
jgi:hypothetical protein